MANKYYKPIDFFFWGTYESDFKVKTINVIKLTDEQLSTNYKFYTNRNVKILKNKMVKRLEKEITSDCGNTFTSFGKLPSPVDPIVKPQVRKLKP